tara:strand:+ start:4645 stop:5775 length:1131 start_codon:yes stop_codon:yes gene_type:complete
LKKKKILIVGAGLAGATIARILSEKDLMVKIIEKRDHIAGNLYDFINTNNERIHKYGPHLLHCNKNSQALKFLTRFTKWINYEHKVRALLSDGRTTPLPINKVTLEDIFSIKFFSEKEVKIFLDSIRNSELIPRNTDEFFEANIGNRLADLFFRPYTEKMWGIKPDKLSISIGSRLPIRTNSDDRYFNDNFQALPKYGYTKMIEKMLDHKNIDISLKTNFTKGMISNFDHSFLCIPIDKFYDFKYGTLPYRSIIFEDKQEITDDLPSSVINFTDNSPYTRMTQWDLLPNSEKSSSQYKTITYEKPCSMKDNPGEYYYPVQTLNSKIIYEKYKKLSRKEKRFTFCGRTGLYKYIDMIPAVTIHLKIAKDFMKKHNIE